MTVSDALALIGAGIVAYFAVEALRLAYVQWRTVRRGRLKGLVMIDPRVNQFTPEQVEEAVRAVADNLRCGAVDSSRPQHRAWLHVLVATAQSYLADRAPSDPSTPDGAPS